MLYVRDCDQKKKNQRQSNLNLALKRLLRKTWELLLSFIKSTFEVSGRIQL